MLGHITDDRAAKPRRDVMPADVPPGGDDESDRSGRRRARSGRFRQRRRPRHRRRRSSRGGSGSGAPARPIRTGLGAPGEFVPYLTHGLSGRREDRRGRTRPEQHTHRNPLRGLRQQITERTAPVASVSSKSGLANQPATWTWDFGGRDCVGDRGQRVLAVDQDLERTPLARSAAPGGPSLLHRRVESPVPPDLREPAPVVRTDRPLRRLANGAIDPIDQHPGKLAGRGGGRLRSC